MIPFGPRSIGPRFYFDIKGTKRKARASRADEVLGHCGKTREEEYGVVNAAREGHSSATAENFSYP